MLSGSGSDHTTAAGGCALCSFVTKRDPYLHSMQAQSSKVKVTLMVSCDLQWQPKRGKHILLSLDLSVSSQPGHRFSQRQCFGLPKG